MLVDIDNLITRTDVAREIKQLTRAAFNPKNLRYATIEDLRLLYKALEYYHNYSIHIPPKIDDSRLPPRNPYKRQNVYTPEQKRVLVEILSEMMSDFAETLDPRPQSVVPLHPKISGSIYFGFYDYLAKRATVPLTLM